MGEGKFKDPASDSMTSRLAQDAWGTLLKIVGAILVLVGVAFILFSCSIGGGVLNSLDNVLAFVVQMAGLPFIVVGAVLWRIGGKLNQKFYKGY